MSTGNGDALFASERRQEIVSLARRNGRVDVRELGGRFGVTTETIRRDLNALEQMNLLRRVHGGAVPIERIHVVPSVPQRATTMAAEKRAIARAALEEVPSAGSVLIDAGTTTARLADIFPDDRELTVVTNALPIAESLAGKPKLTVHLLGGRVRSTSLALVDAWALRLLAEITVDVAFLGAYGVSPRRGFTTPDTSEAAVKRAMVDTAHRVIVLADHTKLGAEHFSMFASLADVDLLITDAGAPREIRRELREAGLPVRTARGASRR